MAIENTLEKDVRRHDQKIAEVEKSIGDLRLAFVEIKKDTEYIKLRIDTGLLDKLDKICDRVAEMHPVISDNAFWVKKMKEGVVYLSVIALGGGLVALFFYWTKSNG